MAVRKYDFYISESDINPKSIINGGMQYEHNATQLEFQISNDLYDLLCEQETGVVTHFRIDAVDGEGGYHPSATVEPETVDDMHKITYSIPIGIAKTGGLCKFSIVASRIGQDNIEKMIFCSAPALIRFESVSRNNPSYDEVKKDLDGILKEAKEYVIASADIDDNGDLIIHYVSGAVINAGAVHLPTTDSVPTEDSTNPVTSGGVYNADLALWAAKQNKFAEMNDETKELYALIKTNLANFTVSTPYSDNDIANKKYVDDNIPDMTVSDIKLNGTSIVDENGVANITVDNTIDEESENPVAGGAVYSELEAMAEAKQDKLTAGDNITIDDDNVISASGGGTVDQSYNELSENAQSGKAVAEAVSDREKYSLKVTSLSGQSTDAQYPSAKCVYDELLLKENEANRITSWGDGATNAKYPSALLVKNSITAIEDNLSGKESLANKVQSLSAQSSQDQYPSAKCVYDLLNFKLIAEAEPITEAVSVIEAELPNNEADIIDTYKEFIIKVYIPAHASDNYDLRPIFLFADRLSPADAIQRRIMEVNTVYINRNYANTLSLQVKVFNTDNLSSILLLQSQYGRNGQALSYTEGSHMGQEVWRHALDRVYMGTGTTSQQFPVGTYIQVFAR